MRSASQQGALGAELKAEIVYRKFDFVAWLHWFLNFLAELENQTNNVGGKRQLARQNSTELAVKIETS